MFFDNISARKDSKMNNYPPLFAIEAMKMESTVVAPFAGKVKNIVLKAGNLVAQDDVVIEL